MFRAPFLVFLMGGKDVVRTVVLTTVAVVKTTATDLGTCLSFKYKTTIIRSSWTMQIRDSGLPRLTSTCSITIFLSPKDLLLKEDAYTCLLLTQGCRCALAVKLLCGKETLIQWQGKLRRLDASIWLQPSSAFALILFFSYLPAPPFEAFLFLFLDCYSS